MLELLEQVREAGVVGAGGAGFPTHVKLNAQAEYILLNGAECEPLLKDLEGVVTKKDKGYIILRQDHVLIQKKSVTYDQAKRVNKASCEQCRMCTDLCPRYLIGHDLQPHKVIRGLNYTLSELAKGGNPQLCCQCNLCQLFSCPAGIYPKTANMIARQTLESEGYRYKTTETEFQVRSSRDYRLVPSKRLVARLGLSSYDQPAPMQSIAFRPESVRIATRQHVGAPAVPCVKEGDKVEKGQLIGTIPEKSLGATIHASITGTVTDVSDAFVVIRRD